MNKEFERLYLDYYKDVCFLSVLPPTVPQWDVLVEWSKEHKDEAVDCIIEMLEEEPSDVVKLCDDLFPDVLKAEGYIPLDTWCIAWHTLLKAYKEGLSFDNVNIAKDANNNLYKDYNAYQKYMENHYIPWNIFKEDDPNITLEDFKQGKRNDKKLLKERLKDI